MWALVKIRGGTVPRVGENVKVKCQNKYCGRDTWVKWGYPSNCEHCGHAVVTPEKIRRDGEFRLTNHTLAR